MGIKGLAVGLKRALDKGLNKLLYSQKLVKKKLCEIGLIFCNTEVMVVSLLAGGQTLVFNQAPFATHLWYLLHIQIWSVL